jgi:N-acetyl-anhydromuramyl-L-alanine amidase AmpD
MFRLVALFLIIHLVSCHSTSRTKHAAELSIITRENWGASEPVLKMKRHKPQYITIHHTATMQVPERPIEDKLHSLQQFSMRDDSLADGRLKKAWADIPYHFYIAADGTIAEARKLNYIGDSNTSYDLSGHILIVLEGNFQKEKISPVQYKNLERLVLALSKDYGISSGKITGHKDQAQTSCPGESLYALLPKLRQEVDSQL